MVCSCVSRRPAPTNEAPKAKAMRTSKEQDTSKPDAGVQVSASVLCMGQPARSYSDRCIAICISESWAVVSAHCERGACACDRGFEGSWAGAVPGVQDREGANEAPGVLGKSAAEQGDGHYRPGLQRPTCAAVPELHPAESQRAAQQPGQPLWKPKAEACRSEEHQWKGATPSSTFELLHYAISHAFNDPSASPCCLPWKVNVAQLAAGA